jgi:hypothetical protein
MRRRRTFATKPTAQAAIFLPYDRIAGAASITIAATLGMFVCYSAPRAALVRTRLVPARRALIRDDAVMRPRRFAPQ